MSKTVREQAIETLFGRAPDKRYQPRSVLQRLGQAYPALMQEIADHAARRVEEMGNDLSSGQLLCIQQEAEALGLRAALCDEMFRTGLTDKKGAPSALIWAAIRLGDQAHKWATTLGVNPSPSVSLPVDVSELWAAATQGTPTGTETDGDADTGTEASGDTDGDTDGEEGRDE